MSGQTNPERNARTPRDVAWLTEGERSDIDAIRKVFTPATHPLLLRARDALERLLETHDAAKTVIEGAIEDRDAADGSAAGGARSGSVVVETGIDGQTQRTAFQNATLSGPFGGCDVSVAVFPVVPEDVAARGQTAIAAHLKTTLDVLAAAGWDVEMQIGPSECPDREGEPPR